MNYDGMMAQRLKTDKQKAEFKKIQDCWTEKRKRFKKDDNCGLNSVYLVTPRCEGTEGRWQFEYITSHPQEGMSYIMNTFQDIWEGLDVTPDPPSKCDTWTGMFKNPGECIGDKIKQWLEDHWLLLAAGGFLLVFLFGAGVKTASVVGSFLL